MATKNNPGKYDCFSKAEPDEPMFVLLGRDAAAALTVLFWISIRADFDEQAPRSPKENDKLREAYACAVSMWRYGVAQGKRDKMMRVVKVHAMMVGIEPDDIVRGFEDEAAMAENIAALRRGITP